LYVKNGHRDNYLSKPEFPLRLRHDWQTVMSMLHSDGQLRTEKDGDTEKGCQKWPTPETLSENGL